MKTTDIENLEKLTEQVIYNFYENLEDILHDIRNDIENVTEDDWILVYSYFKEQKYNDSSLSAEVREILKAFYDAVNFSFIRAPKWQKKINDVVGAQIDTDLILGEMEEVIKHKSIYNWAKSIQNDMHNEFFVDNEYKLSKEPIEIDENSYGLEPDDYIELYDNILSLGVENYVTFKKLYDINAWLWSELHERRYDSADDFIDSEFLGIVVPGH